MIHCLTLLATDEEQVEEIPIEKERDDGKEEENPFFSGGPPPPPGFDKNPVQTSTLFSSSSSSLTVVVAAAPSVGRRRGKKKPPPPPLPSWPCDFSDAFKKSRRGKKEALHFQGEGFASSISRKLEQYEK